MVLFYCDLLVFVRKKVSPLNPMLVFERPEACYCYDDGKNRYERETPPHILHASEQVHSEDTGHEGCTMDIVVMVFMTEFVLLLMIDA